MDALLIIDMQEASFSQTQRYKAKEVVDNINKLSQHIRHTGGKIIFIQHDGNKENDHEPMSKGWEILSSLTQKKSDITVSKTICDAFYQTDLKAILDDLEISRLIITGCATDFCVDTTIRVAVSHEYHVVVASDCHTTADRPHLNAKQVIDHHNWLWGDLIAPNSNVDVLSLEQIIN